MRRPTLFAVLFTVSLYFVVSRRIQLVGSRSSIFVTG